MAITIRTIEDAELGAWIAALHVPFFVDADAERQADIRRPHVDRSRCWAAFEDGLICGTFRSLASELTLPGGAVLPASAITGVTVLPTHRRRGVLTRMMAADLAASVERGEPLAILIASEYPIYGRYGFGRAADHVRLSIETRAARFLRPGGGSVALAGREVLRDVGPGLYERFRCVQPGSITRKDFWWDMALGFVEPPWPAPKGPRYVVHRDEAGEPQGYLRYHVEDTWNDRDPACVLVIDELLACSDDAYARLWRFACEVDLVTTVKAEDRSPDEPLPWLLEDARAVRTHHRTDFLWVRVLDPVAALEGRRYLAPGRVVLEVRDEAGYASGTFALDGGPDGAACRRTDGPADLALDAAALGSVYLGGFGLRTLAAAGRVEERRPGALARADAMFRWSVTPWCTTWF